MKHATYTVDKLAKLAGVSGRTLHYYDEIGLLKPSYIAENGYRYYQDKELLTLQQIMFFRELEFPLEEIKTILSSPKFDHFQAYEDHKKVLQLKRDRLNQQIKTIDMTLSFLKGNSTMDDQQLYGCFNKQQMEEYQKEAERRWGDTDAYKQSQQRTKNWTPADYKRVQQELQEITRVLADLINQAVSSDAVQQLIVKHHAYIEHFYDCPIEMYRSLGRMYVDDKRFAAFYEKFHIGLAQFICEAINYYCDHH